ncbi:CDCA2 protein, partial [Chaetops frenatus]|nr:CDCA2 protein [Chaetops frenatus]
CGPGSGAVSELSTRKAGFVEDVSLGMLDGSQAPVPPMATGNIPRSSSRLRSILRKTSGRELMDGPRGCSVLSLREFSHSAIARGGGESTAVSNCVKAFETLQAAEKTYSRSSKASKRRVTFGEVLSPEIFDQSLPANTPLSRGAYPGCPRGQRPWARLLSEEPVPLLDFGLDEGVQSFPESSVAAEALSPVENAKVAESDKLDMRTTRSSTGRKQCRAVAEDTAWSSWGTTNTENNKESKNQKRNKIQRKDNSTTAVPK